MKIGMNMLLWSDNVLDPKYLPLFERLKKMGYDGVEIPMFDPENVAGYTKLGRQLDEIGLERTVVTVLNAQSNAISPDPKIRKIGTQKLTHALESCQALGAKVLVGPYYAALGEFSGKGPTREEWDWSIEALKPIAEASGKMGITMAIEFLNRFEIYLLNCAADTLRYTHELGGKHVGVLFDTFHAQIEEKKVDEAILSCGSNLVHIHISENDRSTPGTGQVHWDKVFKAIKDVKYDGWLTIEAFGQGLPALAAATKIWRRMFPDEETLARNGIAFIRSSLQA